MKIDNHTLKALIGLECDIEFQCNNYGLINSSESNTITFVDTESFVAELNNNKNISVVITNKELAPKVKEKLIIISEDPRYDFFDLLNKIGIQNYKTFPSIISKTAKIHPKAFVSEINVIIGDNTIIQPNATILADVEIGDNCIIDPSVVIGAVGYEYKRTSRGILPVFHGGKVIIKNKVEIGASTTVDKGFSFRNTIIDDETKIDNNVYVAHGSHIGKRVFIVGCAMLSGSVTIGDDVWIGPNATLSHGINVGNNAFITLGSVVTKDVKAYEKVTGNFAIPHNIFMDQLKKKI